MQLLLIDDGVNIRRQLMPYLENMPDFQFLLIDARSHDISSFDIAPYNIVLIHEELGYDFDVLKWISLKKSTHSSAHFILFTESNTRLLIDQISDKDIFSIFVKPFDPRALIFACRQAVQQYEMRSRILQQIQAGS